MRKKLQRQITVLLCVAGLAFLTQYQLIFHLTTHVGGNHPTDYYHFHWNYWWIRHALANGLPLFQTDYVMFPATTSLAYHTLAPLWFPLWAIFEPLAGQNAAINLILYLAAILNGYAMIGWLRAEQASWAGALLGGVLILTTSYLVHALEWTVLSMIGWFWIPVVLLLIRQTRHTIAAGNRRHLAWPGGGLALAVWGIGLTDLQYFFFGALLIVPYGVREALTLPTGADRARLVGIGAAALLIGGALLWAAGPLAELARTPPDDFVPATAETRFQVTFPEAYAQSPPDHYHAPGLSLVVLPLAGFSLLVGLAGRRTRPAALFWGALCLVPLLLMGGFSMQIGGLDLSGLHRALYDYFGGLYRYPVRWMMIVMVGVAMLASTALRAGQPVQRIQRVTVVVLILLLLADSDALRPKPIQTPPPTYTFYEDMRDDGLVYTIIEAPVAASTGEVLIGPHDALTFQYNVVTHGKRITGGHFSRAPVATLLYLETDDPLLSWLGQRRYLDPDLVEPQLRHIITDWPLGYIVLHFDHIGYFGPTNQEIVGYFNQLDDLLCPVAVEGDAMAYRSTWHPDGCPARSPPQISTGVYQIDIGAVDDWRFLGWGWHWAETVAGLSVRWTGDWLQLVAGLDRTQATPLPQAALYVDLPAGAYRVTFEAQSFETDRTATLSVNGQSVGTQTIPAAGLAPIHFDLPAEVVGDGQHLDFVLTYDPAVIPAVAQRENNPRQLALLINTIRFERIAGTTTE